MAAAGRRKDWLHWAFEASLASKAFFDGLEALCGALLLAFGHSALPGLLARYAQTQVSSRPDDWIARALDHAAAAFSMGSGSFYGVYLLTHGLLKVAIVVLLMRGIRWAYPLSIVVLGVFVAYQLHRFALTHSPMMLALTALDLLVIALTIREWRMKRRGLSFR